MGFFSWRTHDTGESISNAFSSRNALPVVMVDVKNNRVHRELNYDGYGEFGGKDFYELFAELNNIGNDLTPDARRDLAIDVYYDNPDGDFHYPVFLEILGATDDELIKRANKYKKIRPKGCEYQGYFY